MRILTKSLMLAMTLAIALHAQAQQWSDVGNQGITPDPGTAAGSGANLPFMEIYNGVPYLVYTTSNNQVVVMRYIANNWIILPTVATVGATPHLAFDNAGVPYVVYQNSGAVNVKKYDGTNWVQVGATAINNTLGIGGALLPKIAFDPVNNAPYIVSVDAGNGINVFKFNGTAWVVVGQQDLITSSSYPSIAFTSTGTPYVVARLASNGDLRVSSFNGTTWNAVGGGGFASVAGQFTSIAMDGSGTPYVVASNVVSGGNKATVYKYNGTSWVTVGGIGFTAGNSFYAQLKFNFAGVPHLVYTNSFNNGKATVMKFDGTNWVTVGLPDFTSGVATSPSLAFDNASTLHVAYGDGSFANAATVMKLCGSTAGVVTSTTPASTCGPGPAVTLAASGSGLRWYDASGKYVGGGTSFTIPSLTATTTVSVSSYDGTGCASPRTNVVATVLVIPTISATTPGSRCGSGSVSLAATPSAGTINWFATSTGGSSIGSGNSFSSPSITTTTTYFAEANNSGCLSAARTAVLATVKELPTLGVGIGDFRCGPGSVNLSSSAFPTGATVTWFAANSGGSSLATGNTFTTPSISNTTTYYAEANFNGCVSASRQALIAEVRTVPAVTGSTGGEICNEGTVTLSATTSSGSQPRWYDVETGGTSLSSATTFTTPTLNATKTYYVEALQSGCTSTPRTAVIATIKPYPSLNVSDVSRCDAGTVSFEAGSTGVVSWFAAPTGGSALATGAVFTTPVISVTTPYFAQATLNGCIAPTRTQVQAIVIATPAQPTITQNNANIEAPVLTSSATAGNQWYRNDVVISGATNTTYTIADAGFYKVQVNNSGCLSPFSAVVNYVITGVEVPNENTVTLYPNPTADELVINLHGFEVDKSVHVAIVDMMGRTLSQSSALGGEEVRVKVSSYQSGQYLVLTHQGNRKIVRSFMKSR